MVDTHPIVSLTDIAQQNGYVGYHWDLLTDRMTWYGPWERIFGQEAARPPHDSESFAAALYPDDRGLIFSTAARSYEREYRLKLKNGPIIWLHETGQTTYTDDRPVQQTGILRMIAAPQRIQGKLGENVTVDVLTNRPNRQYLLTQLSRVLNDRSDLRQNHALLVAGIDKMSFVNAAVGAKAGDALLRGVADRLVQLAPQGAIVARVGGDSFGILLLGRGSEAKALTNKLLISFRDAPVITAAGPLHISLSIGGVQLRGGEKSADELLINAELALHEARMCGRNQYVEHEDSPKRNHEQRARLEMAEKVKLALKTNNLKLAFQPIVASQTDQVYCYEALVRIFDDEGAPIAAAHFIPLVEELGLALTLDRQVLGLAIAELEAAPQLRLAINVSALTAAQADWPTYIESVLGKRPDVAERLIIEITETAAIMDVESARNFINTLKRLGGRAALDDFGAGFTSIRHLHTLKFDFMKIDRELLLNLIGNPLQEHLVRTLVYLARGLGLRTIAEGIEDDAVATWLRNEDVELLQGYFFGKPSFDRPWASEAKAVASVKEEAAKQKTNLRLVTAHS